MSDRLFTCEHCRYWSRRDGADDGKCQRHAPIVPGQSCPTRADWEVGVWHGVWPTTQAADTCGDFSWQAMKDSRSG